MQHNLEGIAFETVVAKNGEVYSAFRNKLNPRYGKVFFDIAKGYFFLLLIIATTIFFEQEFPQWWWIAIIPSGLLIGYIMAYLALFIHEAGHFNIHPNKKINDKIATLLLCLPFGLSMKSYRKIHWQHHLHLGTPEDAEISYFNALTTPFILETITGIHLLKTITKKNNNTILTKEQVKQSRLMLMYGALIHVAIITTFMYFSFFATAIAWALAFGVFFPFFATIRQILEHRDELAKSSTDFTQQKHGKVSRLFVTTILNTSFGAAGFTRHMIHHWDPQISYTRLKDIELFLSGSETTASIINASKTTYHSVLKKLITAP
jgi:fatty acid desaturase